MKKLYFVLATLLLSVSANAIIHTYTAYGNGEPGNPWLNGVIWDETARDNRLDYIELGESEYEYTITYHNVPAGECYEFFIYNNDSSDSWDCTDCSPTEGVCRCGSGNSMVFSLTETKDVTISIRSDDMIHVTLSTPTAVQEAQADTETSKVIKMIENGQVILNYPDGTKRNMLGQPLQ